MDPNYFQPIVAYLDMNRAMAVLYFGEIEGVKIELAIDRDRVALSYDSPGRSMLMGYHIADRALFVNGRPSGPERLPAFQELVDQVQVWGQNGQLEIQLIPQGSPSD